MTIQVHPTLREILAALGPRPPATDPGPPIIDDPVEPLDPDPGIGPDVVEPEDEPIPPPIDLPPAVPEPIPI